MVGDTLVVTIENTSAEAKWTDVGNQVKPEHLNEILVDSMTLEYPALLLGPTGEQGQINYRFRTDQAAGTRNYRFAEMNGLGFHLYDVDHLTRAADGVIRDLAFQGQGCAISTASASLMTEALKGRPIAEVEPLFVKFHDLVTTDGPTPPGLGKLGVLAGVREFPSRVKCATLAWHALKAALDHRSAPVATE